MKVIFLKDAAKFGRRYEIKDVSDGFALNHLIPQGIATAATPDAIKRVEALKKKIEVDLKVQEELSAKNIKAIEGTMLTIRGKANEKGHLFAGLHTEDIARELLAQSRIAIDPSFIALEHPLKEIGEHSVKVTAGSKSAVLKIIIERA